MRKTTVDARRITRRSILAAGASLAVPIAKPSGPLNVSCLDHLEFFVKDRAAALSFYRALFGCEVFKSRNTERRYLRLGESYLAMEQGPDVRVDHFCAGIAPYDITVVHDYLKGQGIPYRDYPSGRDLAVTDPEGNRLQLAQENGWTLVPGNPESPAAPNAIFEPLGLRHIVLNVPDLRRATLFYGLVLGPPQVEGTLTWFSTGNARLGLAPFPPGAHRGADKVGIAAIGVRARASSSTAGEPLLSLGARVDGSGTTLRFQDPDGYWLEVS
jgi:catechol 2,3-dioxygenase-like lactoylglutathione lyase family enzyme